MYLHTYSKCIVKIKETLEKYICTILEPLRKYIYLEKYDILLQYRILINVIQHQTKNKCNKYALSVVHGRGKP